MTKTYYLRNRSGGFRCSHVAADAAINVVKLVAIRGRWSAICRFCGEEVREPHEFDAVMESNKELN